ncbi:MAG TPA: 30S ribosomal protein THX [Desulfobacterales bacterium]|nr:30S ribosomal protein THX [Desulfobacterales bacterium]
MGRGDKRSKKGKIWRGTHGKVRPKKKKATEKTES